MEQLSFDDPEVQLQVSRLLWQGTEVVRRFRSFVSGREDRFEWAVEDLDGATADLLQAWKREDSLSVLSLVLEVSVILGGLSQP